MARKRRKNVIGGERASAKLFAFTDDPETNADRILRVARLNGVSRGRTFMQCGLPVVQVAVLFLLCAGCEPISPTPRAVAPAAALAPSATPVCTSQGISNGNDFVSKKVLFVQDYVPSSGIGPDPSQLGGPVSSSSPFGRDLAAAFRIASPQFEDQLCGLTNVFIVTCTKAAACTPDNAIEDSWGLREWKGTGTGTYIGISEALWQNAAAPPSFDKYRGDRLALLLRTISGGVSWPAAQFPPRYKPASPTNTGAMSVLAALAHEVGHVLWYEKFVPVRGGPFVQNNFCNGFYTPGAWSRVDVPPARWIGFGERVSGETHRNGRIDPIVTALRSRQFRQASGQLALLYNDTDLTGTLGAVSPDEDFVETYTLYVLVSAKSNNIRQLRNLDLSLGNGAGTTDVADFDRKPGLKRKMQCFGSLPAP